MYIRKVEIKNIRSIKAFEMEFPEGQESGWHVLIGDNGAGKSSIVRAIAAVLIGPEQIAAVLQNWEEWLRKSQSEGSIQLELVPDWDVDTIGRGQPPKNKSVLNVFNFQRAHKGVFMKSNSNQDKMPPTNYNWSTNSGWFSVAYGPFRRFTGGDARWSKVYYAAPKAGAHLSVFGEDVALTEALDWLKDLDRKRLKEKESVELRNASEPTTDYLTQSDQLFHSLKSFINQSNLLPGNTRFDGIDIDGNVRFVDNNDSVIKVTEMSDGYRSILSLTFELIRQLTQTYGVEQLFSHDNKQYINLPGVVIIDEIDAHLHPTWQTRIGQWFTKYFPNIQFIVTTHSPLVCRGCVAENGTINGSIWRLAAPGSEEESGPLNDTDRDRLVYGNVLDAFGTGAFGENIERTKAAQALLKELAQLDKLHTFGQITPEQDKQRLYLQKIFTTDVISDF
jgi:predicted ATPase